MKVTVTRSRVIVDLPAGEYSVGDPCYAMSDDAWDEFLEGGHLDTADAYFVEGVGAAVPADGDGGYEIKPLDDGVFAVDSGLIGVLPGKHDELIHFEFGEDYRFVYGIRNGRLDLKPAKRSSRGARYTIETQ